MTGPNPDVLHPLAAAPSIAFLKPLAAGRANVDVGNFTYYDDAEHSEDFFTRNVLYHFDFIGDRLRIGSFCAIATGARFIMNGGGHAMGGFSTFPFNIFGHGWDEGFDPATWAEGWRGDTVIGSDVWIGRDATIMPGLTIGAGAIIATGAMVTRDVAPYTIVAGNPAELIRSRFDATTIDALLDVAWWDWPLEKITRNVNAIRAANIDALHHAI